MIRWLYILPHLLLEAGAARRDARGRFLKAQVDKRPNSSGTHDSPMDVRSTGIYVEMLLRSKHIDNERRNIAFQRPGAIVGT